MKSRKVDVAIIGAGTAGLNARREAEKAGKSYVMIEEGPYGTTCARVGCMPSKLLIAAADAAHHVATAGTFGVEVGSWNVDGEAVMKRVREERDRFAGFVVKSVHELPDEEKLRGHATFTGPDRLVVDHETEVQFEAAVIAAGSSPFIPPQLEDVAEHVLTNDDVFDFTTLPASMAIFGTGIIGLEIGQALQRLGVKVQFFNPYEVLGFLQDPEIISSAREILCDELEMSLGIEVHAVTGEPGNIVVEWSEDGERKTRTFECVLAAAGRRPNLAGLSLSRAGIELDGKGRPKGWEPHTTRIGESRLFMAGDVTGHRPVLHEASDEGRMAGSNAASFPDVHLGRRREPMGIAFTDPNMAFVGQRWNDLEEDQVVVGEVSFSNQGRARVMAVNRGILRVYANLNCEFIGAEMFAPRAEHLAHELAWAAQSKLTVQQMMSLPYYHPTVEEGVRTAIRDLGKKLGVAGQCPPEDRGYGPGG